MGKHITKFQTVSEYEVVKNNLFRPNTTLIEENELVIYSPYIPPRMDIITYKASSKLSETTSDKTAGLHTNAFNTTIKSHTFEDGVGTIEFNGDVTSIGNSAFTSCNNFTSIGTIGSGASVEIPDSVTLINEYAFYYCTGLTSVIISDSVKTIGQMAFQSCLGITDIIIGSGITKIKRQAFYFCRNLVNITVEATTPPSNDGIFGNSTTLTKIYVPSESVDAYKAASDWSYYASIIEAIP